MAYIENWLALGVCVYSRKTADAALAALREKGLSVRQIAGIYGVSYTFVRNRLLAAGVNLERWKR